MFQKYQQIFSSHALLLTLLVIITFFTLYPCLQNDFTNWDDPDFVVDNTTIHELSIPNLKNILTQVVVKNWHPLTMLSYSVEYHFFKLNPFPYHLTNLILHLFNTLLVYGFIILLTRNKALSFLTALLFGIHPMHVESIAWISERKDVLYTFFYLSSLISYILFLKKNQKPVFLILSLILFFCSVTSKVTAVSLPIVLFLLDYFYNIKLSFKLILEKVPFFALSLIAGIIILLVHQDVLTLRGQAEYNYSLLERFFLTNYGLLNYLIKLLSPINLSAIYPYPAKINNHFPILFYLSFLIILAISALIVLMKYKEKKLIYFGSLFFMIVIFVNLPFSIIGEAMIADRYTYLSSVGFFLIISYIIFYFWESKKTLRTIPIFITIIVSAYIIWLSILAHQQCKVWKNAITLWSDVIKKNPTFGFAYYNRGTAYTDLNNSAAAIEDFNNTLKHGSIYLAMDTLINRGQLYAVEKNYQAAIDDFSVVIKTNPRAFLAYNNRGLAYLYQNQFDLAIADFYRALEINPKFCNTYNNLGIAYLSLKDPVKALAFFEKSVSLNMNFAPAYYNISKVFYAKGDGKKALEYLARAQSLGLAPNEIYFNKIKALLANP